MSSKTRPPGFFWLLAVLGVFAVSAGIVKQLFSADERPNPRDIQRAELAAEVKKSHKEALVKMGLVYGDSAATLAKVLPELQKMPMTKTATVVPGSPTQLQQSAAAPK
jgi:hypothetical protein